MKNQWAGACDIFVAVHAPAFLNTLLLHSDKIRNDLSCKSCTSALHQHPKQGERKRYSKLDLSCWLPDVEDASIDERHQTIQMQL